MPAQRPRYYLDTSVFGGCFDRLFARESNQLIEAAIEGKFTVLISQVVLAELEPAPERVRAIATRLLAAEYELLVPDAESDDLWDAYMAAKVVGPRWADDARHVANATTARANLIVSWNFKHLVNVVRIREFNAVNMRLGYPMIDIRSPRDLGFEGSSSTEEEE